MAVSWLHTSGLAPFLSPREPDLHLMETGTETFLVKIWLEKDGDGTTWRGRVTHVRSGERRHLKRFTELRAFMMPYIVRMGLRQGLGWKIKQWWKLRVS